MGISNAVAGGIMTITMVYVIMTLPGLFDRNVSVSNTLLYRSQQDDEAAKTSIGVSSLSLPSATTIGANVTNTGSTKVWDYSRFTVIVTYDANVTNSRVRTTEMLSYGGITATPAAGQWSISSFDAGDQYNDPQIVNPGEQFSIRITPQNAIYPNPAVVLTISAPNGAVASKGGAL
jgi:flagellar protein FlaF